MPIRKAVREDAHSLAHLLYLATGEIVYTFIREENKQKAINFLYHFTSNVSSQYSFENCWVIEEDGEIVAAASVYNGADLVLLRAVVLDYITEQYGALPYTLEDETEAGEYYIDSIGVSENHQGKGLGTLLLQFLIEEYVGHRQETLGLLVDDENPKAKKLYLSLGFEAIKAKTFAGKAMEHLQIKP